MPPLPHRMSRINHQLIKLRIEGIPDKSLNDAQIAVQQGRSYGLLGAADNHLPLRTQKGQVAFDGIRRLILGDCPHDQPLFTAPQPLTHRFKPAPFGFPADFLETPTYSANGMYTIQRPGSV